MRLSGFQVHAVNHAEQLLLEQLIADSLGGAHNGYSSGLVVNRI